ncbi:MAG: four helix bundle protein [Longimicrobiales bacterium]
MATTRVLDHERLEVYQVARQLSREVCRVRTKIRPGRADIVSQLLRSTAAVPLNIAEGNGEATPGRRAYFFRIARSSATEVSSALDHLVDMSLLEQDDVVTAKELVVRIVSMLVRLTAAVITPDSLPPFPNAAHESARTAHRRRSRSRSRSRARPLTLLLCVH